MAELRDRHVAACTDEVRSLKYQLIRALANIYIVSGLFAWTDLYGPLQLNKWR